MHFKQTTDYVEQKIVAVVVLWIVQGERKKKEVQVKKQLVPQTNKKKQTL